MSIYLHRIETLLPPNADTQDNLAGQFGKWARDPVTARMIRHVFRRSGIHTRHSVLRDFADASNAELFREDSEGQLIEPTTQARNRVFARHAAPMAVELARRLLQEADGFAPADVTHVITATCTGFVNPGPEMAIVNELGLSQSVERYNLGFMGCYAAIPALRMARQFCLARPDAVVLVVCLELCSLHMQMRSDADSILGNALFADGAGAALVSARRPADGQAALKLDGFMSALAPEGRGDMAWEVGDRGFNLVLSSYVPDIIGANIGRIIGDLLVPRDLLPADIDLWAVHPGGKSILDKFEEAVRVAPEQIADSRAVLRDCGNMSSATILFVLQRMFYRVGQAPQKIAAMAFGPGLTIECGLLETVPARVRAVEPEPAFAAAGI
jgi:predicted naringenin-chalcone synthase